MSYTLASAAKATGLNKWMILRAIRSGELTAMKDQSGEWHVEPDELHRVFPAVAEYARETDIEAMLREAVDRLRQQLDAMRCDRDDGRNQAPPAQRQRADQRERCSWWQRLVSYGNIGDDVHGGRAADMIRPTYSRVVRFF